MTDKTSLGDRMKQYEATSQTTLLRRTPIIIRIDGRAFHTFTKRIVAEYPQSERGFTDADVMARYVVDSALADDPFSIKLHTVMTKTAKDLFDGVQNAVFIYTQSDEISILLRDWDKHETQQWFGGNVQKMVSLSASIATESFNHYFMTQFESPRRPKAHFDSRVYNIPQEEVTNYFIWRQQDASRNSVQMLGHFFFSQKQMHGKSNNEVQDMMMERGVNWNDLATWKKRGSAVYKKKSSFMGVRDLDAVVTDLGIPIFTQDRDFVERHLTVSSDEREEFRQALESFAKDSAVFNDVTGEDANAMMKAVHQEKDR
ncbi:MAG: hypothetical protein E4H14_02725 [Candidatus Thorarchaeota archaeon]|nr:MAG: hypothetical protein E4H14_02725 [Candidatus Thorarchaeota archaeon]